MKQPVRIIIVVSVLAQAVGCSPSDTPPRETGALPSASEWAANHVDARGAEILLEEASSTIVLDVRTPEEFERGRVPAARLINYYDDDFADQLGELDRDAAYLVYCQVGGRSSKALTVLKQLGFKHVAHLDGGFSAWEDAGLPAEK